MKKLVTVVLCIAMCIQMAACGGTKNDKKWIEEGTAKLGTDLRDGEFVLDGDVYAFPMELSDWLDRGWHVSNNYENKDEFTLEPGEMSTEFELFNEDGDYVRVSVFNVSDEEVTVEHCMVASLYISLSDFEIVFPGGINAASKPADVKAAYGEPDEEDSEPGTFEGVYNYTSADGWACTAEVFVHDNDYTIEPFSSIEYELIDDGSNWDVFLTKDGGAEATIKYVDEAMKASFYEEFDEYVLYYDTQENAEALYDSEMEYYAEVIMSYADVDYSYIDDATWEAYIDIAKEVLAKTRWEITLTDFDEEQLTGTMEITLYPTDFLSIISDDVDAVIGEFQNKYGDVDYNSCPESQIAEIELDYANMVLSAIRGRAAETQEAAPVTKTYSIDFSNGVLNDHDWNEIDDVIMGIAE